MGKVSLMLPVLNIPPVSHPSLPLVSPKLNSHPWHLPRNLGEVAAGMTDSVSGEPELNLGEIGGRDSFPVEK